jgi:Flp pilus assembly protein TadD
MARRGDGRAEQHAREAIRLVLMTDILHEQADAYVDLGDVLERVGRHAEATEAFETAVKLYEAKGDITGVAQAQSRLSTRP